MAGAGTATAIGMAATTGTAITGADIMEEAIIATADITGADTMAAIMEAGIMAAADATMAADITADIIN